jgi:hypothetical protein
MPTRNDELNELLEPLVAKHFPCGVLSAVAFACFCLAEDASNKTIGLDPERDEEAISDWEIQAERWRSEGKQVDRLARKLEKDNP